MNNEMLTGQLPEIRHATRRGQFLLVAFAVLAVAFAIGFQLIAIPFIKAALGATPRPGDIVTIKWILATLAGLGMLSGLVAMWQGGKTLRYGQYPAPGAWVWRDTRIKRNPHAARYGWGYMLAGALSCIVSITLVLYAWNVLNKFVPQQPLRKGVTILQENTSTAPSSL